MAMLTASSYSFVMTLTRAEASNKRMRGFLNWKKENKLQYKVKYGTDEAELASDLFRKD